MPLYPGLFLDRDGVIIENRASYVRAWEDVYFFPQALAALAHIRHIPHKIIMVTNQSAVGRGILSLETVREINDRVVAEIVRANGRIDATYICPDPPGQDSPCRKPRPGMLLQAAREHHIDLARSIMVGDALTDVRAGRAAGIRHAVLVRTGRGRAQEQLPAAAALAPLTVYEDLTAVLRDLLP